MIKKSVQATEKGELRKNDKNIYLYLFIVYS